MNTRLGGSRTQRSYDVLELILYIVPTFDGETLGASVEGTARAGTNGPVHV